MELLPCPFCGKLNEVTWRKEVMKIFCGICEISIPDNIWNTREHLFLQIGELVVKQIQSPWISVKDRLPEEVGYYLCTYIFDNHRFYYDRWFNGIKFSTADYITHWMPVPPLPEEK